MLQVGSKDLSPKGDDGEAAIELSVSFSVSFVLGVLQTRDV